MLRTILMVGFGFVSSAHLCGQAAFEVASIKPSAPQAQGHTDSRMSTNNGSLNYTNVTLKDVVGQAYKVPQSQITGPDWIDSQRFDIAAKIPAGARDQVPQMLQTLLSERFKMAVHRENKELPVYDLTIAKNGPKLKKIDSESGITSNSNRTRWHLDAKVNMRAFAEFLSERVGRPVRDRTGLNGSFAITLDWAVDDAPGANENEAGPSLFTALQEQLGLKLDSTKGPVETIVVDHADRSPSDN
jgi:uncharacterized protein (TIGR03435 family)